MIENNRKSPSPDINGGTDVQASIDLGQVVFSHLEKGYLQPSLIGTLYTSASFYLSKYLCVGKRMKESMEVTDKGISFVTSHYNQILELLGKIYCNKAYLTYQKGSYNESKHISDDAAALIRLAQNQNTIDRYLGRGFRKTAAYWDKEL